MAPADDDAAAAEALEVLLGYIFGGKWLRQIG